MISLDIAKLVSIYKIFSSRNYINDRCNFQISFTYQKYNQGYKMKNAICHFMYIASYAVKTKTGGKYIF